jgi:AGZA family xanthine/uracil permease-like MFS transporter
MTCISRYFDLYNNGTDIRTEVLAGLTSFLATMYIIVVNPAIVQASGMPFNAVLTATVIVSAFASIAMGLYAKNPIIMAPGMSLNHLFAYSIVKIGGVPWEIALGCVFWAGAIFLVIACFDRQKWFVKSIPRELRFGIAGGIGLFIALIGFENAGLFSAGGGGFQFSAINLIFLAGMVITGILMARRVPGSFIIGIIATIIMSLTVGRWWGDASAVTGGTKTLVNWKGCWSTPDFSLLMRVDFMGSLKIKYIPVILVFLFSCIFDGLGTCVGVCEAGNLIDEEGEPRHIGKSLRANAFGMMLSSLFGTSPATAYIESATGIKEGGRTGLTAVAAGIFFLPFLFLSPLLSIVPGIATAPVLVLVGVFMLKPLIYLRWDHFDESIPFFLSMIIMPLTHSISLGIVWGLLSWTAIKIGCNRWRQVPLFLWAMDAVIILVLITSGNVFH